MPDPNITALGRISGELLSPNLVRYGVDLAFDTNLLYLKVSPAITSSFPEEGDINPASGANAIGIRSNAIPNGIDLLVENSTNPLTRGIKTNNLIVNVQADVDDFSILSNSIQRPVGNIYITPSQLTDPAITVKSLKTDDLTVTSNEIKSTTLNGDIEISPTGRVTVTSPNFNVLGKNGNDGNIHATGDITWDGNITIGDSNTDSIDFNADISSSLIPNVDDFYTLGTNTSNWNKLYSNSIISDTLTVTTGLNVNGVELLLAQGNTIYVSVNGNDTNRGDHLHATYKTVKHALSQASAGDEIVIFPGTYTEDFPLTVPAGVSVKGAGIRAVTIQPSVATKNKDAFLLNGENTISFLTVKNFYYDSVNNTGYGFRLAQNAKITTRSPYVFHCTIITQGSVTSPLDPFGFNQGDAGRGALIDGSVVAPDSNEASGLFFSVTMIIPNADGITVTNGARCEWLNSFTYYAKRGIYLTRGTLGFASLGSRFGAEMRSINSANVYGTYGAVADGAGTLAYLIGHNFGYIGTGANNLNDRGLVIQANEILATNSGEIYYDSMDHKGDYRIGDIFYVNQDTGQVSFDASSINFGSLGSIVLESPNSITVIDKDKVQTGNIRFSGNTVSSLSGPVNVGSASNKIYLNTNVTVTGLINITQDVLVKGTVYLGNDPLDTITIVPNLTQTIQPKQTNTYTLGTTGAGPLEKQWDEVFISGTFDVANDITAGSLNSLSGYFEVPNIKISGNQLSVTSTNNDLILTANGTGGVRFENIKVTDTTISNYNPTAVTDLQKSIVFSPNGTGNTAINSTKSLVLPVGNNTNRTLSAAGEIRYNNTTNLYEGWAPSGLLSFNNIWDNDRNTYVTAELTPAANDNIIRFGINGTVKGTIDSTTLYDNTLYADNVSISSNTISNLLGTDLFLAPNGTGVVNINNILVSSSGITNTSSSPLVLASTGTGYFKFGGNKAIVIPTGTNDQRRLSPEMGEVRQNTNLDYMEVFNGTAWIPATGLSGAATAEEVVDILNLWSLVLG